MFGVLKSLTKATLSVAVTPVDIVKDVVTMGGVLERDEPYTVSRIKQTSRHLQNAGRQCEEFLEDEE